MMINRREIIRLALIAPVAAIFKPKFAEQPLDGRLHIYFEDGQRLVYIHQASGTSDMGYTISRELLEDNIYPGKLYFMPMAAGIELPRINP